MKLISILMVIVIALLVIPSYGGASTVFETTGWIVGADVESFPFVADVAPFTYEATITDLSIPLNFGLRDIFLSISTSTQVIDYRYGEGSLIFPVAEGTTYFANLYAEGTGRENTGNYGLLIEAVPIPGAVWLLGSGLVALVGLKRRFKK